MEGGPCHLVMCVVSQSLGVALGVAGSIPSSWGDTCCCWGQLWLCLGTQRAHRRAHCSRALSLAPEKGALTESGEHGPRAWSRESLSPE